MGQIRDNPVADGLAIFLPSKAAHTRLMDDTNRPLTRNGTDLWDANSKGLVAMSVNPVTGQIEPLYSDRGGRLRLALFKPLLQDSFHTNSTVNTAVWQALAGFATIQNNVSGLVMNSTNSVAVNAGYAVKSHRRFAKLPGQTLAFRASIALNKVNNSIAEIGFADGGAQLGVTPTAILDQSVGAYWRWSAGGSLVPVVSYANTDVVVGADVAVKPNLTDFHDYLVTVEDLGYRFSIYKRDGTLVAEQVLTAAPGMARELAQPSLSAFVGIRNSGVAPASAPVLRLGQVSVGGYNTNEATTALEFAALQGNNVAALPSTLAANLVNVTSGTAPTAVALTNTTFAAGNALGGKIIFNAVAGSENDLGLCALTNTDAVSAGMTFICTGYRLDFAVGTVAIATTNTLIEPMLIIGDTTNPNAGANRKVPLGAVNFPVGASVGENRSIDINFAPVAMPVNRLLGIALRIPTATATATQTFRCTVTPKGNWVV